MKGVFRLFEVSGCHESAPNGEHDMARGPERRHKSRFACFARGKPPLRLVHEPLQEGSTPEGQALDLVPGGGAHLACCQARVWLKRSVKHTAHLIENVARVIN